MKKRAVILVEMYIDTAIDVSIETDKDLDIDIRT